ncbi:MAG: mechanosensitive ion channel family protein [Clostridia bacterium]|nr:mechanosensitive ion channel family protein [Clostridia bacterium]
MADVMKYLTEQLFPSLARAGIKLLIAIVLLVVLWKLINALVNRIEKGKAFGKLDPSVRSFLGSFASIGLKIVLLITVAAYLGVPMASMVAVLGSAGLAIGLALQGSLSNLAGGVMILIFKQFKVGDYIVVNGAADEEGTVQKINILYTTLLTADNREITIPNGALANGVITNNTATDTRRVDLNFSVSYTNRVEEVKQTLVAQAMNSPLTMKDPAPRAILTNYGESTIDYTLRYWTTKENYWESQFALREAMQDAFAEAKIEFAFPQLDVHLDK